MPKSPERENNTRYSVSAVIRQSIDLNRLRITEHENYWEVQYGDENITVTPGDESVVIFCGKNAQKPRLETSIRIKVDTKIFHNKSIDIAFREVVIFHLLRRREYMMAGFEDDYERAKNDEILYVIKYFSVELQKRYLIFAKKYRMEAQSQSKTKDRQENTAAAVRKVMAEKRAAGKNMTLYKSLRKRLRSMHMQVRNENVFFHDETEWLMSIDMDLEKTGKCKIVIRQCFSYLLPVAIRNKYGIKCESGKREIEYAAAEFDQMLLEYDELYQEARKSRDYTRV